ncbi:Outer membrane protein assembly factor BamA precursor [compost metagenome]
MPFSEVDTVFFGIGAERSRIETDVTSPIRFKQYVVDNGGPSDGIGSATTNSIPLTAAWQRDSRDSALTPSIGRYQRVNLEADLIGDQKYFRAIYEHQYFRPLFSKVTLALKGELDYGHGIGKHVYPVFKNFYGGGIGSVRGYLSSSLGAVEPSTNDALGGASRLIGNAELQMPFPGSGNDRSLRWFGFLDGGQVYQEGEKMRLSQLRYSAGLGISWISPVGPLKLSYAKPLNAKPTDRLERFQFQMGTGF